ncbi:MAG TPA: PAS domain-containing protein [Syntrophales bacterium]|nr:PAS domain-containing protein [Syntrophales bacterium]
MDQILRILILEDNPLDAELMQFELREAGISFDARVVSTEKDFRHELRAFSPDLILSDYDLPQYTGFMALAEAKRQCPDTPLILVTGAISEERAIETLTGGAKDYVMKGRLNRLAPAVRRALAEAAEVRAHRAAEAALRESEQRAHEQLKEIHSIYESVPVGLCVVDRDFRCVRINQKMAEFNGVPAADHIGRTVRELIPDLAPLAEEVAERVFRSGEPALNIEFQGTTISRPHDRRVWVASLLPLKDAAGQVTGISVVAEEITERRKMEEALRQSYRNVENQVQKRTAELQAVLDLAPVAIWIAHDPECRQITGNTQADAIMRAPRGGNVSWSAGSGAAAVSYRVLHGGRELKAAEMPVQVAAATGQPVANAELELVFDDGRRVQLLEGAVPLFDASGRVRGAVAAGVDVSSLKEAEAVVRRNNRRMELLSLISNRLLASGKPQELVEELCRQVMDFLDCQAFFNYLADDRMGKLHLNACAGIPEETARAIEWLDYGVAVCGCAARDACRIVAENIPETPDIRTELVESLGIKAYACHPLLAEGRVIGTLSFGTKTRTGFSADDLAMMKVVADQVAIAMHRILNEEALRSAHRELERLVEDRTAELQKTMAGLKSEKRRFIEVLDALPAYVVLLTPDHHVPFENRFFRDRFGEAKGRRCFEFLFGRNEPCEICETYRVLDGMKRHEWEWAGPDGRNYYIFDFPFYDTDGSALILEMGLDITEKKRTDAELEAYRHGLEEMVKLRTAQLEEANRELESFSYSVSHDLRAPLRAIDGFSLMLLRDLGGKLDSEAKRKLGVIRSHTAKMGQLIDDVLAFSRIGREAMSMSPIDLHPLIVDAWESLSPVGAKTDVDLKILPLPMGYGDGKYIRQVFANLLSNAVKFTRDADRASIEVGGRPDGNENVYYVRDNGIGFDMKHYDRLFGIFQRLHRDDEFEGTGVGLSIVKRIVENHGGRVWAEGKVGEGAVFYFSLPGREA